MPETLRQDMDFNGLFKKLGHHLEEIRIRTLENILAKLEHKVICDSDLVQERHLFIRLLEWFNFPNSTRHADVLGLLLRLSANSSAAETIQDVGGIEFLTGLRKDVTSSLQPTIDQIIENTMRLPDLQAMDHVPECIYQKHNHTGMTTGIETTIDGDTNRQTHEHSNTLISLPQTEKSHKLPDYREPPLGFFEEVHGFAGSNVQCQQPRDHVADGSSCFRMTIFPWLALTPTDRHVILSTNSSLQSREPAMLVSMCEFLSDVVFQDFPAEIFLQRTSIIKNLVSLLSGPVQDLGRPRLQAIRTLADYASCLKSKIRCHQDPNLYTAKQNFSSTPSPFSTPSSMSSGNQDSHPSVIGWAHTRRRGDGRDGDTSGSSAGSSRASSVGFNPMAEREEMDFEDFPSLQYTQMTIPQFCALILEKSLNLLKTSDEVTVTEVLRLLNQTLEIIVLIVMPGLWQDSSMAGQECSKQFIESLDVLAELVKYHHHSNMSFNEDDSSQPAPDIIQHRLAYIGVGVFLGKFLKYLVPIDKASGIISKNLLAAINIMVYDESLNASLPDLQVTLLGYLKQLDEGRYSVYVATATVSQSLQKTCKFLTLCQEEALRLSKETLTLCEGAFISLPYHGYLMYVTETIKLSSDICTKSQHYEAFQAQYRKLVLAFLAHPSVKVRQHAYIIVQQLVQCNLSVTKAIDPSSTCCDKVKFLLNSDILYEMIVFGLADKDGKVSSVASEILCHLLKSQLLMTQEMWQGFLQAIMRGLPVLQSYAGINTVLGTSILSMLETKMSSSDNELSQLQKLRGILRCMLSSDLKVRSDALQRLSWHLTHEENCSKKLPVFSEMDVSNLANIFVVDTPRSVDEDLGRSVFQVDGLRKVFEIVTSLSVDPAIKKSAIDQLAIILQDPGLHSAFKKDGGFEKILEHIQLGVLRHGDSNTNNYVQYLPGCVAVLRSLLHHDHGLRHKLAHDSEIYTTLVRVALLCSRDERTCYEVSHALTLLLFDEQARFFMGESKNNKYSVPHIVKIRFKLPFRPHTHYDKSPNECMAPLDPDPLLTSLPLEMLRISWNIAWHNGMDTLVKYLTGNKPLNQDDEFSAKLKLSPTDLVILTTSHIKQGLQSSIYDISNSTSHYAVSRSLTRLLSHLVARYDMGIMNTLHTLDWCGAIARFVKVTPSSTADESLLLDILHFINIVLKLSNQAPDNILQWVGEVLYHPKGPLSALLQRHSAVEAVEEASDTAVNIKQLLDKSLLAFISTYNSSLPYVLTVRLKFHHLRGDVAHKLLQRLNVTDVPHFYNLASLEGTLQCLMHITARPGWSQECTEQEHISLCCQVLCCLLEVVSAFHIGRGGTAMSFMGKGVTKAATLCLRHLAYEMATLSNDQTWPKNWLYCRLMDDTAADPGLDWMLILWSYRDAEVRTAGLGIAVTLSSTHEGRQLLTTNCKHVPGGIWAVAFSILLDQSECSMVRQQAALLLVNLTSQVMPSGSTEADHKTWQGPVVMDIEYQVSLVGLTALLALLHHCQFYREMTLLLSNYYPQPSIQPDITSELYQLSSSSSENTSSILAEAGVIPRNAGIGSLQSTLSMLQSSAISFQMSGRPGLIGANGHFIGQNTPSSSSSSSRAGPLTGNNHAAGHASSEEVEGTAYQSVTTPCLVSAVSLLVRNLIIQAPQDTVTSLKNESLIPFFFSMIDASFLEGIQVLISSNPLRLFFTELVEMHINILHLLQTCLVHDTSTRMDILQDKVSLGGIVSLLRIFADATNDTQTICYDLWEAVLCFLTTLIQIQGGPAVEVLAIVLQKQWSPVTDSLQNILEGDLENRQLYINCLKFLSVLCCEEGKLRMKSLSTGDCQVTMTTLLNQPLQMDAEDKDMGQVTPGSQFCKSLISSYDHFILRKSESAFVAEKIYVITALKSLLSVSQSAKSTAVKLGLVENLIEHIKQTHAKLMMNALQVSKASAKVKDDPIVQELIITFDLLRNFMFRNEDVKMACYHSGLQNIVHQLWSWCQLEAPLMLCVLSLLTTFTASCPSATSSLAYTSAVTTNTSTGGQAKASLSPTSLVHSIIKYAGREKLKEPILKCLFSLLSNMALSSECRNIIWKNNFLNEFSNLNPKRPMKTKGRQLVNEVFWLELLLNLSFSLDGQQMILKITDVVDILLEFLNCDSRRQQEYSALIIRNLCCHASNKPKVLANEKLLPTLLQCVESNDAKLKTIGASALWVLVYNNQKAKVVMKNANVVAKLQGTLNNLDETQKNNISEKCLTDIEAIIQTVNE